VEQFAAGHLRRIMPTDCWGGEAGEPTVTAIPGPRDFALIRG
jgi:hypothetical protein